ncbi:TcpE family conjugal transfer membrane protein, partial [Enterococcus faecalis]
NFWLTLIVGVGVLVWALFSLKWDNKSFLDYLIGPGNFLYQKKKRYEHGLLVQFHKEKVQYKVSK